MCGGTVIPPVVKEKRRNSEKRKEKSRDAARCRRSKESEIFHELTSELPLPRPIQLDKTSVMRLTVAFLKFRHMLEVFMPRYKNSLAVASIDPSAAEILRGFLLILTDEGNMIFLSENVHTYLGTTQAEMMGQSIYEFTHPCDHDEIKTMLTIMKHEGKAITEPTSFFIRMKSTVKPTGRSINLKSSSYQVIHCIGHKVDKIIAKHCGHCPAFYLISIAEPVPHPLQLEDPFDKQIFFSKHTPDMKFTDVDDKVENVLGYTNNELVGKSVYSFYHASDMTALKACYKTLFRKGQCETGYYRFLAKYGGHVWLLTQATVIYDNSTKPESIICLNYVLSKTENEGQIVSSEQVLATAENKKEREERAQKEKQTSQNSRKRGGRGSSPSAKVAKPIVILSSTKFLFAPKQEVMNKNYLNFPDADLLLFQESGKESKLSLDLEFFEESGNTNNVNDDPFISYRDDSLSPGYCGTPDSSVPRSSSSGSPDHFSTTPSTPDSGSLSDIPNLDPIDEFANLDLKLTMSPTTVLDKDCDPYEEINFQSRAPYISMNMDDDFPLISPSNSVMWGPQEPIHKRTGGESITVVAVEQQSKSPKSKQVSDSSTAKSSLAALLQSDLKKHPAGRTKAGSSVSHRDVPSHKKWHNSAASDGNNRNNVLTTKVSNNASFHKQSSLYNGNSSSTGHIVMLDTLPSRKQLPSSKSSGYQHRKSGHNLNTAFLSNHSQAPPPLGSHTATVKVNDRLIKVQVSVSELPATTMEQQRSPSSSPVEPVPPKRLSPSLPGPTESPKRMKVDNHSVVCQGIPATESVLLNLLISGEDASRGYLSSGNSKYPEVQQSKSVALPLPTQNANHQQSQQQQQQQQQQNDSVQESVLLASESELLDSFLNISQYDADVNAPIQVSHLLQGEDLLDALDLPPSLRDVPALV